MVGKTEKDFSPSPAEVTERERIFQENNKHALLKGLPGGFKSFPAGDLFERDNASEAGVVRFLAGVGGKGGEAIGDRSFPFLPENETLRSELIKVEETFFFIVQ